ncbi:MAG: glycine C-acetyltransferase [Patescibacteria group bacterium]|jgi:glycine C-acetyltransferase
MNSTLQKIVSETLHEIDAKGLMKREKEFTSPQGAEIIIDGKTVISFCANNYLGLANDPVVKNAIRESLDTVGFGLSSVRFIVGTQEQHRALEKELAAFVGQPEVILYSSCFDANGGLFETLLGPDDAIISDALNHASIIDGTRLCKAERLIYAHSDMANLEEKLKSAQGKRVRMIATDGVFSMDGEIAKLKEICDLAERYDAAVMVDDSHGTGLIGASGKGSLEVTDTIHRIDILTSTLGKALGGASGGFTAASPDVVHLLRQRSRPYLFSNSVAPLVVAATRAVLTNTVLLQERREMLKKNTEIFRARMTALGFTIPQGVHPIVPVMLGDAHIARAMAEGLLEHGIFAVGFWYPVVPEGKARIRVQLSALHTPKHIARAVAAFESVGKQLHIIS